jgi:hypothetical protein
MRIHLLNFESLVPKDFEWVVLVGEATSFLSSWLVPEAFRSLAVLTACKTGSRATPN